MVTPHMARTANILSLAPFRGLRYAADKVSSLAAVTSPPYDVVVRPDQVRYLETADPHNVVRLILPHTEDPAQRHELAAHTLRRWRAEGVLVPDPEAALYIYEQRTGDVVQRGVIGTLALDSPVLPHEGVVDAIVVDRADLMRATRANLEPLLLVYHSGGQPPVADRASADGVGVTGVNGHANGATSRITEGTVRRPPLLSTTTEDGVRHRLWAVTDPQEISAITADLARYEAMIADGHHRWATYQRLRHEQHGPSPWDLGLVLLVDTAHYPLRVRAIHRVLYQLPVREALSLVDGAFQIERVAGSLDRAQDALARAARSGNAFLLTGDGAHHLLTKPNPNLVERAVPAGRPAAWRRLDATVLHSLLLDELWGVPDSPDHIGYLHDAEAARDQAHRNGGTAVILHPVAESTVRGLAQQGVTMPRKSTSFGPKPATGLVLRDLDLE